MAASYLSPKVGKALLWVVDLIQTIPALALLGVIMVVAGPGSPTAMIGPQFRAMGSRE